MTTTMQQKNSFASFLPWIIWILGAVFYAYEYLLRITPSVMVPELMRAYSLNAASFGLLAALYHYAYVPMQLPVGVMMDKYGPRRLLTVACLICASGSYLFVQTEHLYLAQLGRILVGFGSAFAFVGVLKLSTIWFSPHRFAMLSGLASFLGVIGAIFGDIVMTAFVESIGWSDTVINSAHVGIILAIILFLVIRDQPKAGQVAVPVQHEEVTYADVAKNFIRVISKPSMWVVGVIGCLLYLPTTILADQWNIAYLQQVHGFSRADATSANICIFAGWGIFAPISGYLSDRLRKRRLPLIFSGVIAAILVSVLLYAPHLPVWSVFTLLFFLGISYSTQPIVFAMAREISPSRASGTAVATTNMLVMLGGGVILQPLVGTLLEWWGESQNVDGAFIYSATSYQFALSILPIGLLLGAMFAYFLKETYGKNEATY